MGHLSEYKSDVATPDGRALGDEWVDWNGRGGGTIIEGKRLFLTAAMIVIIVLDILACAFVYLISPRIGIWWAPLPHIAWGLTITYILLSGAVFVSIAATVLYGRNLLAGTRFAHRLIDIVFSKSFRLAEFFGISRDRMGHSFVRVSNSLSRALRPKGREEKLLILLPRCLSREELREINDLKGKYPLEIHTVSGGELARKKVKEIRPTAVIGVACERDLVSGIRDVGSRLSVIGIPNKRPEGPCKNTHLNMAELIDAIEFYVGPSKPPLTLALSPEGRGEGEGDRVLK